jgi:hypothetical protein
MAWCYPKERKMKSLDQMVQQFGYGELERRVRTKRYSKIVMRVGRKVMDSPDDAHAIVKRAVVDLQEPATREDLLAELKKVGITEETPEIAIEYPVTMGR